MCCSHESIDLVGPQEIGDEFLIEISGYFWIVIDIVNKKLWKHGIVQDVCFFHAFNSQIKKLKCAVFNKEETHFAPKESDYN